MIEGAPGEGERTFRADWVVGSTARSLVCRCLGVAFDGEDYAQDWLMVEARIASPLTLEVDAAAERELALRHVLVARSLQGIGDNALDLAEQAACLATAGLHEFTDASRPKGRRGGGEQ